MKQPYRKCRIASGLTRREFLKGIVTCGTGALLLSIPEIPLPTAVAGEDPGEKSKTTLAVVEGHDPAVATREALNLLGGIEKFVKKGQVVAVKPNMAFDREPEFAANTNPYVVAAVVQECLKAGAREVKVFDHTVHPAVRAYEKSGIAPAAREAGAKIIFVDADHKPSFRDLPLPKGKVLKSWPMFTEALDADVLINIPIAKHHGLTRLTLGIKNLMGIMGGNRAAIHPRIHQCLADIATEVRPHLTILDAYRILVAGGPQGGRLEDVRLLRTIVASTDPVAVDSFAATLPGFDMKGEDIGYIRIAHQMELGEIDLGKVEIIRKKL